MRMRAAMLAVVVCSCALVACRDKPVDPMAKERRGPLVIADQAPLPEDPAAGKRSEEQWKKHLQAEEVERRMVFDRNHLNEHHDLIKRISAARDPLERAKTPDALKKAQAQLEPQLSKLQAEVDSLDRYKNTSRLVTDYDALLVLLKSTYPSTKLAAMGGNAGALSQVRNDFDAHLRSMHAWLERLDKDEDEALDEGGGQ